MGDLKDHSERERVQERTEQNRKAIPVTILNALAGMSITLDDILRMSRQEFDAVNRKLFEQKITDEDRTRLIDFKHDSMTHSERLAYIERTDAEWEEMEKDLNDNGYN